MNAVTIDNDTRGSFEEAATSNTRTSHRQIARPELRASCDALLVELVTEGNRQLAAQMAKLADLAVLRRFFVRSTIENVRRIELMRKINPLVCVKAAATEPVLCKEWGLYAADEGLHSRMFARDLHAAGVGDDQIYATPPLFSTELLCGYLYHTLEEEGPMAVVASGYYVESVSRMTQPAWLDRIDAGLGAGSTRGSRAHLTLDDQQDHVDEAWNMCMRLIKRPADEQRFIAHLRKLHALLGAYVGEVLAAVIDHTDDSATAVAAVRGAGAGGLPS